MDANLGRRGFLKSASALGLGAGLGGGSALMAITPARGEDLVVGPDAVRFRPEIEPVVRWIEETPRERAFDVAVEKLRAGLSYRDLMAGLFLAGIRNIKPRPVGFKFHAVMVINSAHLLGQTAAVEDRLLPMFWALENFKSSQAQDIKEGDWTLNKVDEARLPSAGQARDEFVRAMDAWDVDAADAAVAALCRNAGAAEVMEPFWRYAVRDQRNIGHKAIFAMQCWRTLQAIGWENSEPVLRSLAYGMLDLQGDSNRAPVGPFEANLARAREIRDDWTAGKPDPGATTALLEALRSADPDEASAEVVKHLNAGVAPGSLWDAVVLHANEMLLRSPGIAPLHAVTSANALHFAHENSGDDTTRRLALLQAAGWMPLFRGRIQDDPALVLDRMETVAPASSGEEAVGEIFAKVGSDRRKAAAMAVDYIQKGGSPEDLFAAARRLIFHKANDSHQYKYGAAAWEEWRLATDPRWQAPLAAAALAYFPSSDLPDSPLMRRATDAVERVIGSRA
jgi:hypothetical protein